MLAATCSTSTSECGSVPARPCRFIPAAVRVLAALVCAFVLCLVAPGVARAATASADGAVQDVSLSSSVVELGQELEVTVELASGSAEPASATLTVYSPETGAERSFEVTAAGQTTVTFTLVFTSADEATIWEPTALTWTPAGQAAAQTVELSEGDECFFNVISDEVAAAQESLTSSDALSLLSSSDDIVVALDPGHGGSESGACYNDLEEWELNWKIAKYCKAELEEYLGVTVVLTKTKSETVSLETRVKRAVSYGADVLISIHNNAVDEGTGFEVYVPNSSSYRSSLHTKATKLANKICAELEELGLYNRGVKTRDYPSGSSNSTYSDGSTADYYGIIRRARLQGLMALIVEHAFVDKTSDAAFLSEEANLKALGVADATAIASYYGLHKVAAPTLKSATAASTYSSVTLKWSKVSAAVGYRIYRKTGSGSYEVVATLTGASTTSWTDETVEAGESYTYRMRAYVLESDGTKAFSTYTDTLTVQLKPAKVSSTSVEVAASLTSATVSWSAVTGATGYEVYRSDAGGSYAKVATVDASVTSFEDTGLALKTTYKYKVRAYAEVAAEEDGTAASVVKGSFGSAVKAVTRPATVSISSIGRTAKGNIKLTWGEAENATGYVIYRKTGSGSYKKVKTIKSGSTTSWTDTSVSPGTVYRYKVRAYTKTGSSTVYSASYSAAKKYTARPARPTIKTAKSSSKRTLTVTWSKVSGASGYQIAYRKKGSSTWYYVTVSSTSKKFTALRSSKYYIKVRAYKKVNGTKYYGSWTAAQLVSVKQ